MYVIGNEEKTNCCIKTKLELQVEELQRCLCDCMKLLMRYIFTKPSPALNEELIALTEKYPQILKGGTAQ